MTRLTGRRVLVVEDEFVIALTAEECLVDAGAQVVGPAATCAEALALLEGAEVDAAMLDINLKGERSDPVAAELRRRGIPFIVVTGYGANAQACSYGSRIIEKPYQPQTIVEALGALLDEPRV